ncbi:MAG: hypothetical protein GC162_01135 [Planctomycetes bacterium]|nr:hypothetical protein [Planctomycetota bacterium]
MATTLEPRSILTQALPMGEPLPGALRDMYGRILIPAGTTLDQALLDKVAKVIGTSFRVYVGPDWPDGGGPDVPAAPDAPAVSPQQRVLQLLLENEFIHDWSEKRQSARHRWHTTLSIAIEEEAGLTITKRDAQVKTVDISLTGLGFAYDQFLHKGTAVYARFDMLPGRPILKGAVRYCQHLKGVTHRIGVAFTTE